MTSAMSAFMTVWRAERGILDALKKQLDDLAVKLMVPVVRECLLEMPTSDGVSFDEIFRKLFPDNQRRAEMASQGIKTVLASVIEALFGLGQLAVHPEHGEGYYVWIP